MKINVRIDPPESVNVKRTESDRSCGDCSGDGKDVLDRALAKKERDSEEAGLVKSWRLFQGLLGDLRRKSRWDTLSLGHLQGGWTKLAFFDFQAAFYQYFTNNSKKSHKEILLGTM